MKCSNQDCSKTYCLYHSNAHSADINCEEYELSIAKETRMNEMAIKAMGDDVKPCPQCQFRIFKNGGCNHMHCVKCGTSFCWLCSEIIEDTTIPEHYREGKCAGQQFDGMEVPPRWLIILVASTMCIFCIPSVVLGVVFGIMCIPIVHCCKIVDEDGERIAVRDVLIICMFGWMILFAFLIVLAPIFLLRMVWNMLRCLYGLIRVCCPCLPECPERDEDEQDVMLVVASEESNSSVVDEQKENMDDVEIYIEEEERKEDR